MTDDFNPRYLTHTEQGKKWLTQFEPLDQEIAISVANSLTLVSHTEFERNLVSKFEGIASEVAGAIGFYAVRELKTHERMTKFGLMDCVIPFFSQVNSEDGKSVNALSSSSDQGSEARVANTIRQLCKSNPDKYLNHPTIDFLREKKCDAIVFVDDFIGSGHRVREFLTSFWIEPTIVSWLSGKQIEFHVAAYSGTEDGIASVSRHKSKPLVHIYRDAPTFRTFFWGEEKKEKIRKLCEKYGRIANKKRKNMWWGYKEGMAALVFEHGCPNNTPAILWEPNFEGSGWVGLFPNRVVSSDVASVFPPEIVRSDPIQILSDVGQSRLAHSGALLRRGTAGQIILTVLALIAKGKRRRSTLCFATGMNTDEYERLIEKCIQWQFISPQRRITPRGLAELDAARKSRKARPEAQDRGSDYYFPRQLRGHK
ncbi:phosphoribosyltransferase-like protein [Hyphococcus sp.]|uniref:phosphoribosyltransferase-like protein n=1 Tax=Hyphococcus sp. TaxID=2038636 RepID=UPI003CCBA803